jgi:hypothetical protein
MQAGAISWRNTMRLRFTVTLSIILWSNLAGGICHADEIAVMPGWGGFENADWNDNVTIGWQFTLSSPVTVTELGFLDANGSAGLSNSHPVGIWNGSGVLLGSTTVPAGTGATLLDGFSFESVTPFALGAGTYTIGAYGSQASSDQFEWGVTDSTSVRGLSMGDAVTSGYGPTVLTLPTNVSAAVGQAYFGPDFMVASPASVPEPSTGRILAVMFGLAGFFKLVRWKRSAPLTGGH